MTTNNEDMSEEEFRARGDAAVLGQLKMMQAAIEALIAVSPKPDYIQFRLAQCVAEIANSKPESPVLAWVPQAIQAGAAPVAERFINACQANMTAAG